MNRKATILISILLMTTPKAEDASEETALTEGKAARSNLELGATGSEGSDSSAQASQADDRLKVNAFVDKAVATTGDEIILKVTVTAADGVVAEIPEYGEDITGFRVIDMGSDEPKSLDGKQVFTRWYKLRADLTGTYIIPGISVSAKTKEGKTLERKTSQIFIEIKSVLNDKSADIKDIKELAHIPPDHRLAYLIGLIALLVIIGLGSAIYFFKKKKRKVVIKTIPPDQEAFAAMRRLDGMGLLEAGEIKRYFFLLSEIFRHYLTRRFKFNAVEKTTEEILPCLEELGDFDQDTKNSAINFMIESDLIKFANVYRQNEDLVKLARSTYQFVVATKPLEIGGQS